MKMKHNRPQKRLITQLSLWLALLLAFTGCAESTVTSQDNTYAIEQLATIPSELLEASETAVSEPESGQPQENASDTQESQQVTSATDVPTGEGTSAFSLREIPAYSGTPYTEVNGNQPYFTEEELTTQSFETYSELDSLGRCGMAYANVGQDLMPTEPRGEIGAVKPSGWHLVKYDNVDGKYLYNRCHLIAYMLAAENANPQNLITGTRYLNTQGMLPFETKVCDYIKNTGNHVLYRVTPIFDGDNLLADGVLMEAYSVEDAGEGIQFCVFAYNVQPGIGIEIHRCKVSGLCHVISPASNHGAIISTEYRVRTAHTNAPFIAFFLQCFAKTAVGCHTAGQGNGLIPRCLCRFHGLFHQHIYHCFLERSSHICLIIAFSLHLAAV